MQASLTIIRYHPVFIPFAFLAMAIHRLPLWLNGSISFYKLMGCGRNGTFDKQPDWRQWAILAVRKEPLDKDLPEKVLLKKLYGGFIAGWLYFFKCETFTILLKPIEGHGCWDGKQVMGDLPSKSTYEGPIAILTRATIRLNKLKYFWQHVAPVAASMQTADGFITSVGIGEIPWIKQATFSVWQSKESMRAFAYGMKEHTEVIKMTRQQKWYSEDMFVRFIITGSFGSMRGQNPLKGFVHN